MLGTLIHGWDSLDLFVRILFFKMLCICDLQEHTAGLRHLDIGLPARGHTIHLTGFFRRIA